MPISDTDFSRWVAASYTSDLFRHTQRSGSQGQDVYITASMVTGDFLTVIARGMKLDEQERDIVRAPLDQQKNSFAIGRLVLALIKDKTRDPDLRPDTGEEIQR